ncbi:hypothetical protein [Maricaulis sp.]|uniref:hypothetical protein n=1 Tax=Maricaulis sp. TaxID=1486257 RepID=UPI003A951563|tara:strand:+ start:1577 stop:1792 length:216 start_codon:yes stop_codon:yes gene_type:complete
MPNRLSRLGSMLRNGIAAWGVVVFALMFCRNDLGLASHDLPMIIFGGFGIVVLVQTVRALVLPAAVSADAG